MERVGDNLRGRTDFLHAAQVHDSNSIANVPDNCQVMCDEQHRKVQLLFQIMK